MILAPQEVPFDLLKVLNEWALVIGRSLQSKQTNYLHFYAGKIHSVAHTIPILENTLFAYALLRSRLMEAVQEAKEMLKHLLAFQNLRPDASFGNFPVYLHEYPFCKDASLGLQLLAPFYWILKQFGHVLGEDLKCAIEQAARLSLRNSLDMHQACPFPYSLAVRLGAAQCCYGMLWNDKKWQQEGDNCLKQLSQRQLEGWYTTKHLADLLIGLQMVYPSLKDSPWQHLWQHMEQTWHFSTHTYIGPCIRELQEREEPQPHLYDLYAGYFAGKFSQRTTVLRPYHLQGVLVQPSPDRFEEHLTWNTKGTIRKQAWQTLATPNWAYTLLEKTETFSPSTQKAFTPFRLIWGDSHRVHSLVCQGGAYTTVAYLCQKDSIELIFTIHPSLDVEERGSQRAIEWFVDIHPAALFRVSGSTATTFELGQPLVISLGQHEVSVIFELLEGKGHFLGHIMRGNRPSQFDDQEEKGFQAWDWTFFLRTIRQQGPCRLKAIISLNKQEC